MKQIEVVAAIIHDADGRIFATQRGYGDFKDFWEFPGGAYAQGARGGALVIGPPTGQRQLVAGRFTTAGYYRPSILISTDKKLQFQCKNVRKNCEH